MDMASPKPARDVREGLRDIWPVMVAAFPIGLLFGALCAAKDLSIVEAGLMSLLVFAGGAQFAAVELWTYPVPILPLVAGFDGTVSILRTYSPAELSTLAQAFPAYSWEAGVQAVPGMPGGVTYLIGIPKRQAGPGATPSA